MAEMQENMSKRDAVRKRLTERYPDKTFDDDEVVYGQINDDYDELTSRIKGYEEDANRLTELFGKDPRAARFLTDMAKGVNPWTALIEQVGIEGLRAMLDDPEGKEKISEAQSAYLDKAAKNADYEEQYSENLSESLETIQQLQESRGLSDEDIDKAINFVWEIINDGILGKISADAIDMALKACNYDEDVTQAREEGVVSGRNAKIVESKRDAKSATDGIPALDGANNNPTKKRAKSIFDVAMGAD